VDAFGPRREGLEALEDRVPGLDQGDELLVEEDDVPVFDRTAQPEAEGAEPVPIPPDGEDEMPFAFEAFSAILGRRGEDRTALDPAVLAGQAALIVRHLVKISLKKSVPNLFQGAIIVKQMGGLERAVPEENCPSWPQPREGPGRIDKARDKG
jgi:hypothetical protein